MLTYGEVDAIAAGAMARLAEAGVRKGDRVAVITGKSLKVIPLYLATLRLGAVYLPLNPAYTDGEVDHVLQDAAPALVVRDADLDGLVDIEAGRSAGKAATPLPAARAATPLPAAQAGDLAVMLYTSGTTGKPKGAPLTHANLASNADTLRRSWGFTKGDVLLHSLPVFHAHGLLVAANVAMAAGAKMRWLERFEPKDVLEALPECSVFMGVPTYYTRLLESGADGLAEAGSHVRLWVSGSAPLSEATLRRWEEVTGQRILERYGMTETVMITSNPLRGDRRPGSVGPPLDGVEVRIVGDEGQRLPAGKIGGIEVRGPNVFSGYWGREDLNSTEFAAGGWFRTGDLGWLSSDGYVTIVGRAKDLVITGGMNVYPKEVESVLDALASVKESAVVGIPDDDFGEAVVAAVVPSAGRPDPAELRSSARERLAGYKVPKKIELVEQLPRNAMGKVDKAALRRQLGVGTK